MGFNPKMAAPKVPGMRHGWFVIPGVQTGDRTFEEQSMAILPAFDECEGKDVLDLGCAEGMISYEFAKRGARMVHGWDAVKDHILVARKHFEHPVIKFARVDLNEAAQKEIKTTYDIVVALGVIHKMHDPAAGLRFACLSARDLLLLRSGTREHEGMIGSKFTNAKVHAATTLAAHGFVLEKTVTGWPARSPTEDVQFWRRTPK